MKIKKITIFLSIVLIVSYLFSIYGCYLRSKKEKELIIVPYQGERSMYLCREIVSIGPRPSGTPGSRKTVEYIIQQAQKFSLPVCEDRWEETTPIGPLLFCNVIVNPPQKKPFILLGTHYDTKRLPNVPQFVGANDGASGVALLLDLMRIFSEKPNISPYPITYLFFDGEECIERYHEGDGFHGSRRIVKQWKLQGILPYIRAFILVDMVGDKDLTLTISPHDHPFLIEAIQKIANKAQLSSYIKLSSFEILDDHTPFLKEGVPSINLIDFSYGPNNSYWHTANDTLDKLSEQSFSIVGTLLLTLLTNLDTLK